MVCVIAENVTQCATGFTGPGEDEPAMWRMARAQVEQDVPPAGNAGWSNGKAGKQVKDGVEGRPQDVGMTDIGGDKDAEGAVEGEVQQGQQHKEQEPEEGLCIHIGRCQLASAALGSRG